MANVISPMNAHGQPPVRPSPRWEGLEPLVFGLIAVIVVLLFWEWVGTTCYLWDAIDKDCKSSPLFTSAPSKIVLAAIKMFNSGSIWNDLYVSGQEFLYGFAAAILFGIPFGLLMGWYRRFNYVFDPFVAMGNATPRAALTPLLLIWLGIGIWSKVALVFLGAIFPIIINTQSGVRALDETLLRAAHSFGAKDRQIFTTIALPGSIPFILSGIRVGLGHGLVGIVIGELLGSAAGIGFLIQNASALFQTDRLWVGVLLIMIFGVLLANLLNRLERRFDAWRPKRN